MNKKVRIIVSNLISIFGTFLSLYVGVYKLIIMNLINFFGVMQSGELSLPIVLRTIAGVIISMTIGGAIWVACDILASKIRGYE